MTKTSPTTRLDDLMQALRSKSHKITHGRLAILRILQEASTPLTNKEIFQRLQDRSSSPVNLVTIYRSMHLLEEMHLVQRCLFEDGIVRYELLADHSDHHRHHLVCRECSDVVSIDECFPSSWEQSIARKSGFSSLSHRLEFTGVCPQCQKT